VRDKSNLHPALQEALRCPKCGAEVEFDGRSLFCRGARRHCYDAASSGYINLAPEHKAGGDSKEAVRARTAFLGAGYYAPIADAIEALVRQYASPSMGRTQPVFLDAGCGEGYYTARLAAYGPTFGFDLSRPAVEAGAKAARRQGLDSLYAVAGLHALPLADSSVDFMLNHFAPCVETEFSRVLCPGGILVVGAAGTNHLLGFKRALYDTPVLNAPRADLPEQMKEVERRCVRETIHLDSPEAIASLFAMTPYYYRTSENDRAKLLSLTQLDTEIEVELIVYAQPERNV